MTMTTHELAKQLMELPDVPLEIEGWCRMKGYETRAKLCSYDETKAIIVQECVDPEVEKEWNKWLKKNTEWKWHTFEPPKACQPEPSVPE